MKTTSLSIKIERKPEVLIKTGFSRSTLHTRIREQLFPPPISLGARAVGWLSHETDTVLRAMIAGKNQLQLKELVASLVAARKIATE